VCSSDLEWRMPHFREAEKEMAKYRNLMTFRK